LPFRFFFNWEAILLNILLAFVSPQSSSFITSLLWIFPFLIIKSIIICSSISFLRALSLEYYHLDFQLFLAGACGRSKTTRTKSPVSSMEKTIFNWLHISLIRLIPLPRLSIYPSSLNRLASTLFLERKELLEVPLNLNDSAKKK